MLTNKERECLYLAAQDKTSREIAAILNISERTANFHIDNIRKKFMVRSRQAAIAAAISKGFLKELNFPDVEVHSHKTSKSHS